MSDRESFFTSRWVEAPSGATEAQPWDLPAGFRAAGVACGIKPSGKADVGLLVCDTEEGASAALFTRHALVSAAVAVSRRADRGRLRAIAINSGNANVADGERGLETAVQMARAAAAGLGIDPRCVGVASTGVIGVNLPRDRVMNGIEQALGALAVSGGRDFSEAILTTDRGPKRAALDLQLPAGRVRLSVQAKGAGMISPRFATMLCFVETDAKGDPEVLDRILRRAVGRSFERITVDGQASTNDSVFLLASGASQVAIDDEGEALLVATLEALLRQVAVEIVADGEGAKRVARLLVRGPASDTQRVARSVADSPLVRCALHGGDPNWGRILAAAGQALPPDRELALDVWVEDMQLARGGAVVDLDAATQARVDEAMRMPEVELRVDFPGHRDDDEAELFFCDLGHDYVTLNSEYST